MSNTVPYATIDMRKSGTVRYTTQEKNNQFQQARLKHNNLWKKLREKIGCPFNLASPIDIDKTKDFVYLVDQDPDISDFHEKTVDKFKYICQKKTKDIYFVPYTDNMCSEPTPHPAYKNIKIFCSKDLVKRIKKVTDNDEYLTGKYLYRFNEMCYLYDSFDKIMTEQAGDNNLIDAMLKVQKDRIFGMTSKQVTDFLKSRNEYIDKYTKEMKEDLSDKTDCDILQEEYYKELAKLDDIQIIPKYETLFQCKLKKFGDLEKLRFNGESVKDCANLYFTPYESYDGVINYDVCNDILKTASDPRIRDIKLTVKKEKLLKCMDIDENTSIEFKLRDEYMPEWSYYMINKKFKEAHESRTMVLGDMKYSYYLRRCGSLVRADPYFPPFCSIHGLEYSVELNKAIIDCQLEKDITFPLRIINANVFSDLRLYNHRKINKKTDNLLGAFVVNVSGERTDYLPRLYIVYLYTFPTSYSEVSGCDFRGNYVVPGTFIEHLRILHVETNTIYYYNEDMKTDLYYYRYDTIDDTGKENYDIYVSKFTMNQIRERYKKYDMDPSYLDKLKQCIFKKDKNTKKFSLEEVKEIKGGNNTESYNKLNYSKIKSCSWKISFDDNVQTIDPEIFSSDTQKLFMNALENYQSLSGEILYFQLCDINTFYNKTRLFSYNTKNFPGILEKIDNYNKNKESILSYRFSAPLSVYVYLFIKNDKYDKILDITKKHFNTDAFLYYKKYNQFSYNPSDIDVFVLGYRKDGIKHRKDESINYFIENSINYTIIDYPMNNENISKLPKKKYDLINLDIFLYINIKGYDLLRTPYNFESFIGYLIYSLQNLEDNGTILFSFGLLCNKVIYDLMAYIGTFFGEAYVIDYNSSKISQIHSQTIYSLSSLKYFIKEKFDKSDCMEHLLKLNKLISQNDPTMGFDFCYSNPYDIDVLGIKEIPSPCNKKYISSILTNVVYEEDPYPDYKDYSKKSYLNVLSKFENNYLLTKKDADPSYINMICKINRDVSIYYAKEVGLPVAEWVEKLPIDYFNEMIKERFINIPVSEIYNFNITHYNPEIGKFSNIIINEYKLINSSYIISEAVFGYIDSADKKSYKDVELFFNNGYKKINSLLFSKGIDVNDNIVSRAWIKMYEMLHDTSFFENLTSNNLKIIFLCEAPGNFINSLLTFVKNTRPNTFIDWHAQSLKSGKQQFFDSYGFIKKTKDRWDLGATKDGDITKIENFHYYLEKYHDVDAYISDCGMKWCADCESKISVYQLLYALLLPRVGGNFIIKTHSSNYDKQFLSLIYIIRKKYNKLLIFKSNSNFWSQEVYFVGIGRHSLTKKETNDLIEIADMLDLGKTIYPVKEIPTEFIKEYNVYIYNIIVQSSDIKKLFIFLTKNKQLFDENKEKLQNIISQKNKEWLATYMPFLK